MSSPARRWLLVALALSGCVRPPSAGVGPFPAAPVVLVSIDTLRADHLAAYGYAAGSTPNIDALARDGIVFEDVYSHCPLTLPAHTSLLTGLLPPHHGVRDNLGFTVRAGQATLASRLHAAGWRTGAAVSAYVLRAGTGIGQGFEMYDDAITFTGGAESLGALQRDGADSLEVLTRWMDGGAATPPFAFLHLYEPHAPYAPPPSHRDLANPYDGEIAYADELVGRLVAHLRASGVYDRAIVVVTSDHGEGLGDHGEDEHGLLLYREAVHVPLVVHLPGGARAGTRVAGPVAQVDIAATLLDLVGLGVTGMDGVSQRAALAGQPVAARPVYSETLYPRYHFGWSELFAATDARWRYIKGPGAELYDVTHDPGERTNVLADHHSAADASAAWLDRQGSTVPAPAAVGDEARERLAALGYVGAPTLAGGDGPRPNPRDKVAAYRDLKQAMADRAGGRLPEAATRLESLVTAEPAMADGWENLGFTRAEAGDTAGALAAFDRVLRLDPTRSSTHLAMAKLYALDGQTDRAVSHAEIAAAGEPGRAFELLAQAMMDRGDLAAAAGYARRSVAADDRRVASHFILGVVEQRGGRCGPAIEHFRRAVAAQRLQPTLRVRGLHAGLGDCLARSEQLVEAEAEFREELRAIPTSEPGRVGLALLLRSQGRDQEARAVLEGLVAAEPRPSADAYWTVVRTFAALGDGDAAAAWAGRARHLFPGDRRFGG